jgi:hypothetical protein
MPETEEKLPSPTPPAPKAKWTITLGGGEWATIKYGVVEYLRQRPKMRTVTAAVGILWVLGWLATAPATNGILSFSRPFQPSL